MPSIPADFLMWRLQTRWVPALVFVMALAGPVRAGLIDETGEMFQHKFRSVGTALRAGQTDVYVTGYCWHLPYAYSSEKRAGLNETTWGGGLGRSMIDNDGDRHSVFFVGFADSHRSPQYILSYGWQRYFTPERPRSFGWGYMAFIFAREDVHGYTPMPGLLPCLSARGRWWEVIGLYVPRISEDIKGDVLFVFLRFNR